MAYWENLEVYRGIQIQVYQPGATLYGAVIGPGMHYTTTLSEMHTAIDTYLGEEPVDLGEFRFDSWNPPLDTREIFIVGSSWPALVRKVDVGESVYAHYVVKNVGSSAGKATITVKDLDTGATVKTLSSPDLAPKERFKTSGSGAYIGKMPGRNWRLEFKVEP
ncbi:hypothetical protein ES703_112858 [subsurface metagenome]